MAFATGGMQLGHGNVLCRFKFANYGDYDGNCKYEVDTTHWRMLPAPTGTTQRKNIVWW
jgi:hypothetical protein